ncbi:MAG: molecular chaperone HscC [Planctomycetales bacterium]|nr:molecular chaperone HscC [Planctomycetales bacterium]
MPVTIGIDLGTTHSLCAVFRDGKPELIPNSHGEFLTPSVVGVLETREIVVGSTARELRITHPERTSSCFKRFMGSDRKLRVADRTFSAHELSSLVLKSLAADAEAFLGEPIVDVVITVPAYFNDHQRQATKLAGELANLHVRRIINEPTAAALVYGFHERHAEKQLCVIDLGGGTFDVTVMEVFEGTLEIRATAGESMLGGEDFTDRIVSAVLSRQKQQLEVAELKQPLLVARLRAECELAKRSLAKSESAKIRLPDANGEYSNTTTEFSITRETFAKLCAALMQRIAIPVDRALRDAGCSPAEIDDVIMVGGATRMKLMTQQVQEYFQQAPRMDFNPDEVVALGAAVQAALIDQDCAVEDIVMTDVCPFTLGVEIVKDLGGQIQDGYFQPILHRNSTIPISREEVFSTVMPNQSKVEIRVFQGDARRVKDNVELGQLSVQGLPPGPAGMPIHIRFSYDLNGLLEVEAYTPGGKKHSTVLTNHVKGLSPAQIQEAVRRLSELKFYPREDLGNQHLARFCERLVGELNTHRRQQLELALDEFESAMNVGDRGLFDNARTALLMTLSSLGIEYDERSVDGDVN